MKKFALFQQFEIQRQHGKVAAAGHHVGWSAASSFLVNPLRSGAGSVGDARTGAPFAREESQQ